MITHIDQILDIPILWNEEMDGGTEFYSYVNGELCQLTLNDYPEEPLYTLRWREFSLDVDDRPFGWSFAKK